MIAASRKRSAELHNLRRKLRLQQELSVAQANLLRQTVP